jgi:hypothetical protein
MVISIIIFHVSFKSFMGEMYLKAGTNSFLTSVFYCQEPTEFFVKYVFLFRSGMK